MEQQSKSNLYSKMLRNLLHFKQKQNITHTTQVNTTPSPYILSKESTSLNKTNYSLTARINELIKKREHHEGVIEKLLLNEPAANQNNLKMKSSQEQNNQCSEIINVFHEGRERDFIEEELREFEINDIDQHVNLRATLALQSQTHLEDAVNGTKGLLFDSLLQAFPNCDIHIDFHQVIQFESDHADPHFLQIISYLDEHGLWEGLFTQNKYFDEEKKRIQTQYFGVSFHQGKYCEKMLSEKPINKSQFNLIICFEASQQKSINCNETQGQQQICIKYVLLKRLLQQCLGSFTFMGYLNNLFAYPFKAYNIHNTEQFMKLGETLASLNKNNPQPESFDSKTKREGSNLILYGFNQTLNSYSVIHKLHKHKTLKNYSDILHKFDKVYICDQTDYQVKSIQLECNVKHFIVLNVTIEVKDKYYITVGKQNIEQRRKESKAKMYKVCIVSPNQNNTIVYDEILKDGHFILATLEPEEYEVYIEPIYIEKDNIISYGNASTEEYQFADNSCEVQNDVEKFHFWMQGHHLQNHQVQALIQVKLKEKYNCFQMLLVEKYLQSVGVDLEEIYQHGQEKENANGKEKENQVNQIIRIHLGFLDFCIDISKKQQEEKLTYEIVNQQKASKASKSTKIKKNIFL